jgi:O-antigen ligase
MSYQALHAILYNGVGTGGFLGDENDVALACCVALPFALQGALFLSGWRRWVSGALALLFTTSIVASSSRGGFIALVAVVAYGVFASPHRMRNLAITVAAALVFYASVPASYKAEVASIFENREHDTGESRTFLWRAAWNMWLDHPVLGVGIDNFNWNVGRYQPKAGTGRFSSAMYLERDWTTAAAHSLYFSVLSEGGAVGSLLFGAIVVGHFATVRRFRKLVAGHPGANVQLRRDTTLYGTGLSMAMVGYLAAGAFLSCAYYPYPWMLSALAVAWERAALAELGEPSEPDRSLEARKDSQP